MAKMEKIKSRLEKRAQFWSNQNKAQGRAYSKQAKDLKKNGVNSDAYKARMTSDYNSRKREYERKYGEGSYYGVTSWLDAIVYDSDAGSRVTSMIKDANSQSRKSYSKAKKWANTANNLSNYTVTDITTKKELKSIYRG